MIPTKYSVDHKTNTAVFTNGNQHIVTTTEEPETHCFIPSIPMVSPSTSQGFKAYVIDSEGMNADVCVHDKKMENVNKNYEMKSPNEKSTENDSESSCSTFSKHVDVKEISLRDCEEEKIESWVEDKDVESGSEQCDMLKIEPTKAEEEALAKGLQNSTSSSV